MYRSINQSTPDLQISLFRIPITDEQAPLATTIDDLLRITFSNSQDYFVFNCQIGRGRTTTGMIICSMALSFKRGEWHSLMSRIKDAGDAQPASNQDGSQKMLLQGYYSCVTELIGMMRCGSKAKRKLDYIIDLSSDMQNIREVIYHYHVRVVDVCNALVRFHVCPGDAEEERGVAGSCDALPSPLLHAPRSRRVLRGAPSRRNEPRLLGLVEAARRIFCDYEYDYAVRVNCLPINTRIDCPLQEEQLRYQA